MDLKKKCQTSIYELVRARLGLRKFQMAQVLGGTRQWYNAKSKPSCMLFPSDLATLYRASKLSPAEFVELILESADGVKLKQNRFKSDK